MAKKKQYDYSDLSNPMDGEPSVKNVSYDDLSQPFDNDNEQVSTFLGKMPKNNPSSLDLSYKTPESREALKKEINEMMGMYASGGISGLKALPKIIAEKLPGLIPGALNMGARVAGGSALGGALNTTKQGEGTNSEKFIKGAEEAAPWMLGGEAAAAIPRLLRSGAELVHPQAFANKAAERIKETYNDWNNKAHNIYESLKKKHGNYLIPYEEYSSIPNETYRDYFSPTLRKMHNKFLESPNYRNAQDLQSQMGSYIGKLREGGNTDPHTINSIEAVKEARDSLIKGITEHFKNVGGKSLEKYQTGRAIVRDITSPHEENKLITKIVNGNKENVKPKQLEAELTKLKESGNLPENHYLIDELKKIQHQNQKGQIAQYAIPMAASSIGGEFLHPGLGAALGAASGSVAGHFGSPVAAKIFQNPLLVKLLEGAAKPYYAALPQISQYTKQ